MWSHSNRRGAAGVCQYLAVQMAANADVFYPCQQASAPGTKMVIFAFPDQTDFLFFL
jgi:hypothetical protein